MDRFADVFHFGNERHFERRQTNNHAKYQDGANEDNFRRYHAAMGVLPESLEQGIRRVRKARGEMGVLQGSGTLSVNLEDNRANAA